MPTRLAPGLLMLRLRVYHRRTVTQLNSIRVVGLALWALASTVPGTSAGAQPASVTTSPFDLVAEMETPPGIVAAPPSRRAALPGGADAADALSRFEAHVDGLWSALRDIDLVALSRFQVDAMDGYELPATFDDWRGKVIGQGEDGRLFLELRGPRLPARYDIVFRYLTVFVGFDPATSTLGRPVVTIRGWIEE